MTEPLLRVRDLQTHFFTERGVVPAVNGISLDLQPGETLGVVGESGCGKSMTALSLMGLVPHPGRIVGGEMLFEGQDLVPLSERAMRRLRGNRLAMIFQDPLTTLNPVLRIGDQISEALRIHHGDGGFSPSGSARVQRWFDPLARRRMHREAWEKSLQMLDLVGIPSPKERMYNYPHEMSGGMRQRVMIAIALSCNPALLIADEPTTALDVTIQAQILDVIQKVKEDMGTSILLITHDLGVVSEFCDRVMVMYAGEVVEHGTLEDVLDNPQHPYTQGLLESIPRLGDRSHRVKPIEGVVPELHDLPQGCNYYTRCPLADEHCAAIAPELVEKLPGHQVSCHKVESRPQMAVGGEGS